MKHSDLNHLRRLLGWVSCEIGQTPDELVATVQAISDKLGPVDIADEGKQRLVEAHDKARAVPAYVHTALKALRKTIQPGEAVGVEVDPVNALDAPANPFTVKQIVDERNSALDMVRKVEILNADLMEKIEGLQARPAPVESGPKDLHAAIMNLRCLTPAGLNINQILTYRLGYKAARHDAAELVAGLEVMKSQPTTET
jgi:hypothetical protein